MCHTRVFLSITKSLLAGYLKYAGLLEPISNLRLQVIQIGKSEGSLCRLFLKNLLFLSPASPPQHSTHNCTAAGTLNISLATTSRGFYCAIFPTTASPLVFVAPVPQSTTTTTRRQITSIHRILGLKFRLEHTHFPPRFATKHSPKYFADEKVG